MLYGLAEVPTVLLTIKRMFSIHNPILDLTELVTFFIIRIVGWFGYGIYLHTHIHSWFKYIYGILTVVFGGLHVLWFGKSFLKFSKKYM
jgi:cytochrome c biogenesis protein CcdA